MNLLAGAAAGLALAVLAQPSLAQPAGAAPSSAQSSPAPPSEAQATGALPPPAQPSQAAPSGDRLPATPLTELLARAQSMLSGGESRAAWELLDAQTQRYGGDPRFDYLLGLAALDSGQPGHAILALERVLAVQPDHLQARAEIARAYLAANEVQTAREQFETVAKQPIPPEVAAVIDRYLSAIDGAQQARAGESSAYAELGMGYDSNVNFGSASGQWLLADGTAVTPLANSRPRSSPTLSLALGGLRRVPINGAWNWTVGGTLTRLQYPDVSTLDQTIVDLSAGLQYRAGCQLVDMQTQLQHYRLDGQAFRNAAGVVGQWRCDLDQRTQVGFFGQAFHLTFPGETIRDANRYTLGATFARALDGGVLQPVALGSLYGGQERPTGDIDSLRYTFGGARASLTFRPVTAWRLTGSISFERRDFSGTEPLFGVTRHDRQTELRLVGETDVSRHWTISPQLIATRNASTLAPSDFRRVQALVFARYKF